MHKWIDRITGFPAVILLFVLVSLLSSGCEREECERGANNPERINAGFYTEDSTGNLVLASRQIKGIYIVGQPERVADYNPDSGVVLQDDFYILLPLDRDTVTYVINTFNENIDYSDTIQLAYRRSFYMFDPACGFNIDFDSILYIDHKKHYYDTILIEKNKIDSSNVPNIKILFN